MPRDYRPPRDHFGKFRVLHSKRSPLHPETSPSANPRSLETAILGVAVRVHISQVNGRCSLLVRPMGRCQGLMVVPSGTVRTTQVKTVVRGNSHPGSAGVVGVGAVFRWERRQLAVGRYAHVGRAKPPHVPGAVGTSTPLTLAKV